MRRAEVAAGETVYRRGEPSQGLYLVESGAVEITEAQREILFGSKQYERR